MGKFIWLVIGIFLLNVAYGIAIIQDISEIAGVLILSLFNTIITGYGLAFWVLLKEKKLHK